MEIVHATCVALGERGVLLRGPSGAGKSDLAVRLLDDGARLVADDRVLLAAIGGRLRARPPATIAGLLEVRGVGIVRLPYRRQATIALIADLRPGGPTERLPEPARTCCVGVTVARIDLDPFEASAPAKLRLALRLADGLTAAVA